MSQKEKTRKLVVGLDIGTTKIACLAGVLNDHGKIEIVSMGHADSAGVMRGQVFNIDQTTASIKKAVDKAVERLGGKISIANVYVGIAGSHIASMQHRGLMTRTNNDDVIRKEEVSKLIEEMYRVVVEPGNEIIHVIPQEYIVDNEIGIFDPCGYMGTRLEGNFHIITGNMQAARNISIAVDRAGLVLNDMILEPLASAEAVLSSEEKDAGVVLVDIGGGTTDVAIFQDGILRHTAVIPFGGEIITRDISEGCRILKPTAEQLKVQYGSALVSESSKYDIVSVPVLPGREPCEISLSMLAGIIQARTEEIILAVYNEIRSSGVEHKLIAGIVVTGGGSQLKHIKQQFEYLTGMATRIGLPTEHLAANNNIENITSPIFSTGIGLVMHGFKQDLLSNYAGITNETTIESTSKTKGKFFDGVLRKKGSQILDFFKEVDED
jgi:cell division protein FtsA